MPRIRIGVRFDPRGSAQAAPATYAGILSLARRAEAGGVDAAWIAERPSDDHALVPSAFPLCAAVLAATSRLRVATGLLPLPLHHPLRVAEDVATLDGLGGGRFELGVGMGSDPEGAARFGVSPAALAGRFDEALEILRAAWGPGPVSFEGRHFRVADVRVEPRPSRPDAVPLWIGAARPGAQRRAASVGAGLVVPAGADVAAYLGAWGPDGAADPGGARLAWLLPEGVEAVAAAARARAACDAVSQLDFVLPLPAEEGPSAHRRLDALLGQRIPALRDLA